MDTDKILSRLGISELNVMQRAAVDAFKIDKDMVLLSPTGTGKTLAFLLPLADALDPDRTAENITRTVRQIFRLLYTFILLSDRKL